MRDVVSAETLRGNATVWLVAEDARNDLAVLGCYAVSARRAHFLAEQIIAFGRGAVVVSVESHPRYERKHEPRLTP